ncbi:MAG: hypothetical protein IT370_19215 [Deltaproteobacteria bacterium]|nr:hypothetical protein [Deltaproteobacteria bacterium]
MTQPHDAATQHLIIKGWRSGVQTTAIALLKFLRAHCAMSLFDAKQLIDKFAADGGLMLPLPTTTPAWVAELSDAGIPHEVLPTTALLPDDEGAHLYVQPANLHDPVQQWTRDLAKLHRSLILDYEENDYFNASTGEPYPGFLGFRHVIHIFAATPMSQTAFIAAVAAVMHGFASRGCQVQAASTYEDQLPGAGRL